MDNHRSVESREHSIEKLFHDWQKKSVSESDEERIIAASETYREAETLPQTCVIASL